MTTLFTVGISELFWDPGSVVSQDLVLFEMVGNSKLIMLAPQQKFRGSKNAEKCFSNAVLWSTDVRFLFIHSLMHSSIHSLIHSFIHSLMHALMHSSIH